MESIHVWWIGERHPGEGALEHVRRHVERAFACPVAIWPGVERPVGAYDARRRQWSSSRILAWLVSAAPEGKVLGLTDVDLFIPVLTFVFGEAQVGGRAALVSTARLLEPALPDSRIVLERLAKESVHEMGHVFGLLHCHTSGCVMGRSASLRDVDRKRSLLCPACQGFVDRTRLDGVEPQVR